MLERPIVFTNQVLCVTCNESLRQSILKSIDDLHLALILLPFLALTVFIIVLLSLIRFNPGTAAVMKIKQQTNFSVFWASAVIGTGLGGFVDGILFHQILQWHEMFSAKIRPVTLLAKSTNMFWDGIFHAFMLVVTFTGVVALFEILRNKQLPVSRALLFGGLLFGWGAFNLIEGLFDHLVLKFHNIRDSADDPLAWNIGFMIVGAAMLSLGEYLRRRAGTQYNSYT